MGIQDSLKSLVDDCPVFIHTDLFNVHELITPIDFDRKKICEQHLKLIKSLFRQNNIWIPTFNYDFSCSKIFDVTKTPSQVGYFTEYIRKFCAEWRTTVPFFSVCGCGEQPKFNVSDYLTPFAENSIFNTLFKGKGKILFYGAKINSMTFLHFIESLIGPPLYRYDKLFVGNVTSQYGTQNVKVKFHVRPWKHYLDYDWATIFVDLKGAGLVKLVSSLGACQSVFYIDVVELVDFWYKKVKKDPFYYLDAKSKEWIVPMYKKLGRRFLIDDFEK